MEKGNVRVRLYKQGKEVKVFETQTECAKYLKLAPRQVCNLVNNNKNFVGYTFERLTEEFVKGTRVGSVPSMFASVLKGRVKAFESVNSK